MGQRLGQHFLKDDRVLERISAALDIKPGEAIIEIGPGHGELTRHILKADPAAFIAVEKDAELAESLKKTLKARRLKMVNGDVLKVLPKIISGLHNKPYKIVGNIPYYITGHLLRVVSELDPRPLGVVITIQKEVAERICDDPPRMSLLSASVRFWGEPGIVGVVRRGSFQPAPKVDSAVLLIRVKPTPRADTSNYYRFIRVLFRQPRKTILNNLNGCNPSVPKVEIIKSLRSMGLSPTLRPGNLDMNSIIKLSRVFCTTA